MIMSANRRHAACNYRFFYHLIVKTKVNETDAQVLTLVTFRFCSKPLKWLLYNFVLRQNKTNPKMKISLLTLWIILSVSCNSQEKKAETAEIENSTEQTSATQIGEYVVETFQDSKGNLWFGTLEKGAAKYDGTALKYLTKTDGLPSNRIVSIIEDKAGNLWLGTDVGISKYDGTSFTNFSEEDGLISNMVSVIYIDSKGITWVGTWGGVSQFDGTNFKNITIPYPSIETIPNEDTKDWMTTILEDSKGNLWFGRDGYGASKYDGSDYTHITKKEGLYSNNVQTIAEDNDGNIWIGTRVAERDNPDPNKRNGKGGLNKFDGQKIIHFPNIDGVNENDVYEIYKDNSGSLWISTTSSGIYEYQNSEFKNYKVPKSTMSILKDKNENIWLGCAGGLFSINSAGIFNVTTNGPWK
jgi:ligand-binding sensor domain-containing protein